MTHPVGPRETPALSPTRLGEIVAHFAFYDADPHAEILAALGYPPSALEQVESARARLHWALDGGIREGGIDELRAFVTAYDVVFRRLRSRRPRLSSAAIDPRLEPAAPAPRPRHVDVVPLPAAEATPATAQRMTPSYLVQPHLSVQVAQPANTHQAARQTEHVAHPPHSPPPPHLPQPPPATPSATNVPNFTIMQASSILPDIETLPFVQAPDAKVVVRPATPAPEHVPTGTTAPSSESPISLPFIAQRAAKEETKLRPDQIDLSLFPLELYAEISGGLARGEDRAKLLASRGLTDSLYDVLAQAWAKKLAGDAGLMNRFKDLARHAAASKRT